MAGQSDGQEVVVSGGLLHTRRRRKGSLVQVLKAGALDIAVLRAGYPVRSGARAGIGIAHFARPCLNDAVPAIFVLAAGVAAVAGGCVAVIALLPEAGLDDPVPTAFQLAGGRTPVSGSLVAIITGFHGNGLNDPVPAKFTGHTAAVNAIRAGLHPA